MSKGGRMTFSKIKITIFQRLLIGIIAVLMLISIISFVGIISINKLERTSKIMLGESKKQSALQNLNLNFQQLLMPANDYLVHGDKVEFINFKRLNSRVKEHYNLCKKYYENHIDQKDFFRKLENNLNEVESLSLEIFKLENPIGNPEGSILMEEMEAISNMTINEISELLIIESIEIEKYINTNQATIIKATRYIVITGLLIAISLVVGGFLYVNEIITPIKKLSVVANKVSLGDMTAKSDITTSTRDEINDFAISFNKMIGVLEKTTISRDYFNDILDRMIDTLIITDKKGKITIVNKAAIELLEYDDEEEIIGQSIKNILKRDAENKERKKLKDDSAQNSYNTYKTKYNKAIPVSFSKSIIYNKNKIRGVIYMTTNNKESLHTEQLLLNESIKNKAKKIKIKGEVPLTNRELEVIKLIVAELSNREIAEKLFISVRTVETHRKNIMQKLHAKSVISLVQYAAQNGII
jgi:PAS domain S-box-containing protein